MGDNEIPNSEEVREYVEKHGLSGIEGFFRRQLEKWKDVEITIGVTGDAGAGKSSLINAIMGLGDEDEGAAKTGVTETTQELKIYSHPNNEKMKFWDLPGIGTPNFSDLEDYWQKFRMDDCHTFLILCAERFTEIDRLVAEKVKSLKKSFFFIRTKIDFNYENEKKKKTFDERQMLQEIRRECLENLKGAAADVFLISNKYPAKWEFGRLTQAILDVFETYKLESLTFSLDWSISLSEDILRKKIEILKGRIQVVAAAVGQNSTTQKGPDRFEILLKELNLYKSQFRLPQENTSEFEKMTPESQKKISKYSIKDNAQIENLLPPLEERAKDIPVLGDVIFDNFWFSSAFLFLHQCLNDMEAVAFAYLKDLKRQHVQDLDKEFFKDNFTREIEKMRDQIALKALISFFLGLVPIHGVSIAIDTLLLRREVDFYRSQLRLPEEKRDEFNASRFDSVTPDGIENCLTTYGVLSAIEELSRGFWPLRVISGAISFASVYYFLDEYLNKIEDAALKSLEDKAVPK